jgi:hypothetical protein
MQQGNLTSIVLARIGSKPAISKRRVVLYLVLLAGLVTAIETVGTSMLQLIAGPHSASTKLRRIVVGEQILHVPENMIRDRRQRQSGKVEQLELYVKWPEMSGFTHSESSAFNELRNILLITIRPRSEADMQDSLYSVHEHLTVAGEPLPSGLELRPFIPESGLEGELLAVGRLPVGRYLARCLIGEREHVQINRCERHTSLGDSLTLVYRFPEHLLPEWRILERKVLERASALLQER